MVFRVHQHPTTNKTLLTVLNGRTFFWVSSLSTQDLCLPFYQLGGFSNPSFVGQQLTSILLTPALLSLNMVLKTDTLHTPVGSDQCNNRMESSLLTLIFFKYLLFFWKGKDREKRETQRDRNLHSTGLSPPNVCNNQGWASPKTETGNCADLTPTWAIVSRLSGRMLAEWLQAEGGLYPAHSDRQCKCS